MGKAAWDAAGILVITAVASCTLGALRTGEAIGCVAVIAFLISFVCSVEITVDKDPR
jgi:hypothetical protein